MNRPPAVSLPLGSYVAVATSTACTADTLRRVSVLSRRSVAAAAAAGGVARVSTPARRLKQYATKVCRHNWHSAGSLGWPSAVLKYKYIFQTKYAEAVLSNSIRKLLRFEITTEC